MIGLLLITHSSLGESLVQCVCHVMGRRPPQIMQLGLSAHDDPVEALPLARELLSLVDRGEGALILTDIYGATPANVAMKLLEAGRVEGVSGVNLPMLLRALTYREKDLPTLLSKTVSGGCDGVINMRMQ